jgi:hypothetical protein
MKNWKDHKAELSMVALILVMVLGSLAWAKFAHSGGDVSLAEVRRTEDQVLAMEKVQALAKKNDLAIGLLVGKVTQMGQGASGETENPFFCPPKKPEPPPKPEPQVIVSEVAKPKPFDWPKLRLDGIMRSGQTSLVLINGRLYKAMARVGALTILEITQNDVLLEAPDGTQRILRGAKTAGEGK